MKKTVIGILAHVDAGKTTLSEALLYTAGQLKKLGRVDNKSAFLDNYELERRRGITIFSKQAVLRTENTEITLLDTPGHIDFSSEAERTLQVQDYAVLVISARDGVQPHTETLWRLLLRYNVPVFIFVNKMDLEGSDRNRVLAELKKHLSENCADFTASDDEICENAAFCNEKLMEKYIEEGSLSDVEIAKAIRERNIFPCWFGSALKLDGVAEFIEGLEKYTLQTEYRPEFGARVFKIARDPQGNRLTYMKITGGSLKARSIVSYMPKGSEEQIEEKVNMLRIYSGEKFESSDTVQAGGICAVLGLSATYPGQGIGFEKELLKPMLEPVLTYRVILPKDISSVEFLPKLKQIEEEDPQLLVSSNAAGEIYVHLMGEIQADVLKSLVEDRFGVSVDFDSGSVIYKETVAAPVEGVGHFEPLRHYAEVHLLIEPGEPESGITVNSLCREEVLGKNWQRLILTHILEKTHSGVLIGAPLADVKITLVAGRAHIKHTEGGDFRQATYRALRQGLMKAKNVLLEPYYAFRLEIPAEQLGRAINDIRIMDGKISSPESNGITAVINGRAPVSEMRSYAKDVMAYTKGKGKLSLFSDGYAPCHNAEKVIDAAKYNPESDIANTPDSVFCSHGAGINVKWYDVEKYMHVTSGMDVETGDKIPSMPNPKLLKRNLNIDDKELEAIMEREFGPIRRRQYSEAVLDTPKTAYSAERKKEYIIVDGYNLIFAWEGLAALAKENFDAARHILTDILCNYRGYTKCELVLVFDGYKVKGNAGEKSDYNGIHLVFTKENETGDMYIEKLVEEVGKNYSVRVVTSDNLIQVSALRAGVLRMPAREFIKEIERVNDQIKEIIAENSAKRFFYKIDIPK
ncbi:MAG: NYN domain-containing protein [Oscillospiraceae bacterium]|nr:NYN domain-containing protein [Oscillospiraceae bacterium]